AMYLLNAKFITAPAAAPQNAEPAIDAPCWTIRTSTETSTAVATAPPKPEAAISRVLRTKRDGAAAVPEVGPLPSPRAAVQIVSGLHRISGRRRSEEHTSELQSRQYLVCR